MKNRKLQTKPVEVLAFGTCQHCKKEQGMFIQNPYLKRIFGQNKNEFICPKCLKELHEISH